MLGAVAGHPAGTDLAPLGDELAQHHDVLVVDVLDPVLAEDADLSLLLLLPGLLFLFLPRRSLLCLRGHPVASPRPNSGLRRPGREPWPTSRRRPWRSILAVAHRRLGPSSSASISTTDRRSPSGVSQERWRRRPTTTTREPRVRDSAEFSARVRHAFTRKNEVSPSFQPPPSSRIRGVTATEKFTTAAPFGVYRSSGSSVRFPTIVIWLSLAISITYLSVFHFPADGVRGRGSLLGGFFEHPGTE